MKNSLNFNVFEYIDVWKSVTNYLIQSSTCLSDYNVLVVRIMTKCNGSKLVMASARGGAYTVRRVGRIATAPNGHPTVCEERGQEPAVCCVADHFLDVSISYNILFVTTSNASFSPSRVEAHHTTHLLDKMRARLARCSGVHVAGSSFHIQARFVCSHCVPALVRCT